MRRVKGILFSDYVRMIRARKDVEWRDELPAEDHVWLEATVAPDDWYPMESFERLGNAILKHSAGGDVQAVRLWGRLSIDALVEANPTLLAPGDPVETLSRFRVLRATYFDFDALDVLTLIEDHARIEIRYHMGAIAEEAASHQTMGFFEALLERAGAGSVTATFTERSWAGDPRTVLDLSWTTPA